MISLAYLALSLLLFTRLSNYIRILDIVYAIFNSYNYGLLIRFLSISSKTNLVLLEHI
jgi:hypothetical protein